MAVPTTTTAMNTAVVVPSPATSTVVTTEVTTDLNLSPSPGCSHWPNPVQDKSNFTLVSQGGTTEKGRETKTT